MSYTELFDENFSTEVTSETSVPVLVDFWAPWCQPCMMLGPVIEELADELDGEVKEVYIKIFADGITLVSGEVCKPAILRPAEKCSAFVTVTEGKYHQIKRMFGVVGLGVNKLHRVSIGKLTLPEALSPGEVFEIGEEEKSLIFDRNDILL